MELNKMREMTTAELNDNRTIGKPNSNEKYKKGYCKSQNGH